VSGPAELGSVAERRRGYCDALVKGGIDRTAAQPAGTHRAFWPSDARLLAAPHPPTAAFVASDYIALGMLSAAETHGIRVPYDLSCVASKTSGSAVSAAAADTIRSPVERLAETGVDLLFDRLAGTAGPAKTTVLPVELIVRESAGPPGTLTRGS